MPRNFPDLDSLERAAVQHKFRKPHAGESVGDYRAALARHVRPIDLIESTEIASGLGWDKQSPLDILSQCFKK